MVTQAHKKVEAELEGDKKRQFMRALLADVRALERMLLEGRFEKGSPRIGAEQEMFLLDHNWRPAPAALQILGKIDDGHFTTELGMFQLEMNADPQPFTGDGFARLEKQLNALLEKVRTVAAEVGVRAILTGILPTLQKDDLGLDNMVPSPRYQTLNRVMTQLRGGDYEFSIKGIDELMVKHDSVMVEACNASFQVHLQVGAEEFANMYNVAQVLAGPVLSVGANSPLLFGKRLWMETRIALFQQAVDTRVSRRHLRELASRVSFGNRWVHESVVELYKEDIVRFRPLVGSDQSEDPMAELDRGQAPALKALRLHNSTVYRWNRACYGVMEGKPHLRIENRVLPAGPSVLDEVANGAMWCGLMMRLGALHEDITKKIEFEQAQTNFYSAAREGVTAHFTWLDGEELQAQRLVLDKLLPLAEEGLKQAGVDEGDVKRYLGVVDARVRSIRTGARWQLASLAGMKEAGTMGERLKALVAATVARQATGRPVAEWERARLDEVGNPKQNYLNVDQYMTTDLFTVQADDSMDLVSNLMGWERIRHVPVEDQEHRLIGLVSYRQVLRLLTAGNLGPGSAPVPVSEVMVRDVITITPRTPTLEAIATMRRYRIGCLPVVQEGRLVGIVTEENFMDIAAALLEQKLGT
ncbi:MAG TPA: glutamate-cysteine ligase family protein [Myxococcota bacterium]|jgi:CBS domain-containing protein/gamma-glutamylcysteine synthetase|nr:glutamate-cysteine ligase family protein [Myxococcota bacterium]